MTVATKNRLEIPDLLFAIFLFAAYAKRSREQCRLRFEDLEYNSETKLLRSRVVKY